ncbi:MAG TPA: flagellar basal body rod protein FlgB [Bacilli bacterium]|nr:flagellar basal body rod protein FlgB [Bacilli bacterium]
MSWMNNQAVNLLERSIDAAGLRQKVLANNIANIDTPGFKRSDVSFAQQLQEALSGQSLAGRRTLAGHIPIGVDKLENVKPEVYQETSTSMRMDGNNVDIDSEMTNLATNQLQYNALIQQINYSFGLMKYAISEGKR